MEDITHLGPGPGAEQKSPALSSGGVVDPAQRAMLGLTGLLLFAWLVSRSPVAYVEIDPASARSGDLGLIDVPAGGALEVWAEFSSASVAEAWAQRRQSPVSAYSRLEGSQQGNAKLRSEFNRSPSVGWTPGWFSGYSYGWLHETLSVNSAASIAVTGAIAGDVGCPMRVAIYRPGFSMATVGLGACLGVYLLIRATSSKARRL